MKIYCLIIFLIFPLNKKFLITNHLLYNQSVSIEDRLLDKLSKISEYKSLVRQLSKKNELKGIHAAIMIPYKPTKEYPYYEIWMGYDHPERYQNVYTLRIRSNYVNNNDLLPHLEMSCDENYIPLLNWRKKYIK
jgi:hypothetical protein